MPGVKSSHLLRPELVRELDSIGHADVVVGIPSFNNARTIGQVVRAVSAGLRKYFPDRSSLIVNSDGASTDGTPDVFLDSDTGEHPSLLLQKRTQALRRITTGYTGEPGKGSALRTIFAAARRLNASACAVVDSDLRSINPQWVELLLEPILREDIDFVAPLYARHKYDGTITNSIVYPMTRALYGRRIRQPIGGDFGFSGRLAAHYVEGEGWESDVARYGIDIWMTTRALADGFNVAQAYLGAKIHDTKDPGADLTAMFTQVVGTVFELMAQTPQAWREVRGSKDVPTFGFRYTVGVEPVSVNVERMVGMFRQGAADLMAIWRQVLSTETCGELERVAAREGAFSFPADLWVRAVYECAASYRHGVLPRQHLLKAIIPLYLGRTAAFVNDTETASAEYVEATIEELCGVYESLKPYLIERWDARRT